jgi:hypothetical protein
MASKTAGKASAEYVPDVISGKDIIARGTYPEQTAKKEQMFRSKIAGQGE